MDNDVFDGCDFYSTDDNCETLTHTSADEAVEYHVDGLNGSLSEILAGLSDEGLTVYAYRRTKVDLGLFAGELVEHLVESVEQDEEYADPDGDYEVCGKLDTSAIEDAIAAAIKPFEQQLKAWTCERVAHKDYSASEIEALLRTRCPQWFASPAIVEGARHV